MGKTLLSDQAALGRYLMQARTRARDNGGDVAMELVELAGCAADEIASIAEPTFGIVYLPLQALLESPPDFARISFTDCINRSIYPFKLAGRECFVSADPWDDGMLQWLAN